MKKGTGIILGAFLFLIVLGALSGGPNSTSANSTDQNDVDNGSSDQVNEPLSLEEQILYDIDDTDANIWVDVTGISYDNKSKTLILEVQKETFQGEAHLRECFMYGSFDIMSVLVNYADDIDYVIIYGQTPMIDTKGNNDMTTVFQVETNMINALDVNWKNLINYPNSLTATNSNFESVYWHPGIL